mgnify:CR=1 FL=1
MNSRRLPPFQSLIAFEAAARLLSFKDAADELFLTPPAMTYRIKELESMLGLALFKRTTKGITLTEVGKQYYVDISKTLIDIQTATTKTISSQKSKLLKVQMLPFMATEIVIPELSNFYEKHPDIDIQIDTKYAMADFQTEDVDVAIRFGSGDWDGLICKKIMPVSVSIICSEQYAKEQQIIHAEDINQCTLICLANDKYNWDVFAKQAGMNTIKPHREVYFNDYTLCLRAAENHSGLTIGVFPLIDQWLNSGRLMRPIDLSLDMKQAYYFAYQEKSDKLDKIQTFYTWLTEILPSK